MTRLGVEGNDGSLASVVAAWLDRAGRTGCDRRSPAVDQTVTLPTPTASALGTWVEHVRGDRTKGATGLTTEERTELAKLRKKNRELKMERDLLKKWAAFFAKESA